MATETLKSDLSSSDPAETSWKDLAEAEISWKAHKSLHPQSSRASFLAGWSSRPSAGARLDNLESSVRRIEKAVAELDSKLAKLLFHLS